MPFTNKVMIEQEDLLDIIKEIRLKLPEDLKQAKWVSEERDRILEEAQKRQMMLLKKQKTEL